MTVSSHCECDIVAWVLRRWSEMRSSACASMSTTSAWSIHLSTCSTLHAQFFFDLLCTIQKHLTVQLPQSCREDGFAALRKSSARARSSGQSDVSHQSSGFCSPGLPILWTHQLPRAWQRGAGLTQFLVRLYRASPNSRFGSARYAGFHDVFLRCC